MKRVFFLFILFFVSFISISSCYSEDYSLKTDAELKEQYEAIRDELIKREMVAKDNTVIFDKGGVQIYIYGSPRISNRKWLIVPIVIINNSTYNISVDIEQESVNSWIATGSISDAYRIPSGKKAKAELEINIEKADILTIEDFEDAEFNFIIYNNDNLDSWGNRKIYIYGNIITIYSSKIQK